MSPRWQRAMPWLVAAALLGLWQGWTTWAQVPEYLLPSPLRIAETLWADRALLGAAWWVTLKITALALLAATTLGTLVAFAFVQSRWVESAFFPYAVLLQVTPVVALAPLIILWVPDPTLALVVCATVVAVFPVISNTTLGLRSVNPELAAYFRLKKASRWQVLWRLRLPSALPHFFAGLRVAGGLALIGAVVAEFVAGTGGSRSGLAYQILQSGYQLQVARMFAALALITLSGVAIFASVNALARAALGGWHPSVGH
jgi:NitT/TauT family transport system permease protein